MPHGVGEPRTTVHWYNLPAGQVLERLQTSPQGLSTAEAAERLRHHGPNELVQLTRINPWRIFASQFTSLLVIILIFAAIVSGALALSTGEAEEWIDAIVIMAIVVINAILGFVQEYRAEKAIQALRALAAPLADVIRDGERKAVPARELVPGDIFLLEAGDRVPADGRILEAAGLRTNEASLTGESTPVEKTTEPLEGEVFIGDRSNMAFVGSSVELGRGRAVAVATGMATELGRIAGLVQAEEPTETPLQQRLEKLGKQLGGAILGATAVIFVVGFLRGLGLVLNFLTAVSLAVAAIPEGLPAVVTITLALGLQRMARRHALLRRLPAAETLGSATVICSDKTGTLTLGEMNITTVYANLQEYRVEGAGYDPQGRFLKDGSPLDPLKDPTLETLLRAGVLNNDATVKRDDKGWRIQGDTTEGTLLVLARRGGMDKDGEEAREPRIAEIGFTSDRKRMTTVHAAGGRRTAYVKGAPEVVLGRCSYILLRGEIVLLGEEDRRKILEQNRAMASRALRVLALAFKPIPPERQDLREEWVEKDLVFLGLVGMIDAPREDAKRAIAEAKRAGIQVVMITGDHALTATAVAREMGILGEGDKAVTGEELDRMGDEELRKAVGNIRVYARVSPEHKMRIVSALQTQGHVVAMTGDGVNDAPALKRADLGIAMGITGTDVAKEASDMVLTDDNFASIVEAIREGRGIFENIRKFVAYLLSANVGEILIMFTATLAFASVIPFLEPIQLLWVNLVTDGLPALALGVDPIPADAMRRRPRDPRESPLSREVVSAILFVGIMMAVGTLGLAYWELQVHPVPAGAGPQDPAVTEVRTVAFTFIVVYELILVFAVRNLRRPTAPSELVNNPKLILAVLVSLALQLIVVYIPALDVIFLTAPLDVWDWLRIGTVALAMALAFEGWKALRLRAARGSGAAAAGT